MLTRPERAPRQHPKPLAGAAPEFQWEPLSQLTREIRPLFTRHWREIALNRDIPLDPDWERYLAYEFGGVLHVLTVRVDGVLAGYLFVCVGPHLHYASTTWAVVDMFWLDPLHRFGWTGIKMFRELEKRMRQMRVRVIHVSEKIHFTNPRGEAVGTIFRRIGYRPIEKVWAKAL